MNLYVYMNVESEAKQSVDNAVDVILATRDEIRVICKSSEY
jgi:hypothetical protein